MFIVFLWLSNKGFCHPINKTAFEGEQIKHTHTHLLKAVRYALCNFSLLFIYSYVFKAV